MEPKFNTTFIPKKSLQADVSGVSGSGGKFVGRREVRGPGFYLMLMIFIVSVIASLGIFGYIKIVENSIQEKIKKLSDQKNEFDEETVALLIRADSHISNAKKVLNGHMAVSGLFGLLEQITLKRVQYTELEYEALPNENALMTISGTAKNFQDVALQVEQFRLSDTLDMPIVKKLERKENNTITFSVEVSALSSLVSFTSAIQNNRINATPAPVAVEPVDVPVAEEVTEEPI